MPCALKLVLIRCSYCHITYAMMLIWHPHNALRRKGFPSQNYATVEKKHLTVVNIIDNGKA